MDLINRYELLKNKVVNRRKAFDAFIQFLEKRTGWLNSPASTRVHLSEEGGLLQHSVGVAETLLGLREALAPVFSEESCIIVGLFHDVGKVGMADKPLYLPTDNEWLREKRGIRYQINKRVVSMGLGTRSLYLVSKYIPLSDAEAQAIAYHDGQYVDDNKIVSHREEPLTMLLHWADYWTAHIYEEGRELKDDHFYYDKEENHEAIPGR